MNSVVLSRGLVAGCVNKFSSVVLSRGLVVVCVTVNRFSSVVFVMWLGGWVCTILKTGAM